MNGEPDHIHILFECGQEISPNVLKIRYAGSVRRDLADEIYEDTSKSFPSIPILSTDSDKEGLRFYSISCGIRRLWS